MKSPPLTDRAAKQIETIRLLQALKRGDEKPGTIILRSLRIVRDLSNQDKLATALQCAIKSQFPNDLAFATAGFTISVAHCAAKAIVSAIANAE